MNESFSEGPHSTQSMRERELELEIAHLNAELEAAKGGDAAVATSRFLAMAANTVDLAMEDARREADDLVAEVSADAEARRDEATRLAAEAEARTATLRSEAENHELVLQVAEEAAAQIKSEAKDEAKSLVAGERARLADEIETFSAVRSALEDERGALESYHTELRRRVQELAESMVSFMTTEPPLVAATGLEDLMPAPGEMTLEVEAAAPPQSATLQAGAVDLPAWIGIPSDLGVVPEPEPVADLGVVPEPEPVADLGVVPEPEPEPVADLGVVPEPEPEPVADLGVVPEPEIVADLGVVPEPEIVADLGVVPEPEIVPEDLFMDHGADVDVVPVVDAVTSDPTASGLFARASEDEIQPRSQGGSLFGSHGARLIEQTSPHTLSAALNDDGEEDERFRSFIAGDAEVDPSRDWLLRPEHP